MTFTILANDANKVVTRLHIPRIGIYGITVFSIIPIILLFYFINENIEQQQEKNRLTADLNIQTNKVDSLQAKVDNMEQDNAEVHNKLEELNELESQLKESLSELPDSLGPIGGLDINASADKMEQSNLINQYKETIAQMEQTNKELKHIPTIWPAASYSISSNFGIRSDPFNNSSSFHAGIDIKGNTGTPVYSSADGTIILAEDYGGYGNTIKIRHSNMYVTLYAHLSEIKVKQGDSVKKGENIGSIGSTGRSTGPHLHYEIIKNGEPIDPHPFMNIYKDINP